jgi:hypothetical protein
VYDAREPERGKTVVPSAEERPRPTFSADRLSFFDPLHFQGLALHITMCHR